MDAAFYDAFLNDYSNILRQFQGGHHQANCTAMACAVDNYLSTGVIIRVSGFSSGAGFIQTGGTALMHANLSVIINTVQHGDNGNHLVIEAENSTGDRHHFANILKIGRRNLYYVDGFNPQQPVCDTNIRGYLSWATIFHYSIGLRVRMAQ